MLAFDDGADILTFEIERGLTSTIVSVAGADFAPVFSPDAKTIAFGSSRIPATNAGAVNIAAGHLYTKTLGAVGDGELLFRSDSGKRPTDWSRDGGYVAYTSDNDVWALPMPQSPVRQPVRVTNTPFAESDAVFSPDTQWIAYQSNDSSVGQDVYVQSFPEPTRRYTVSVGGGSTPRWKPDGSELFYVSPDSHLMVVSITRGDGGLTIGRPVRLFQSRAFQGNTAYDVTADGRFLVSVPLSTPRPNSIGVVINWPATIKP
jgi:Tol biopolymer transport system component